MSKRISRCPGFLTRLHHFRGHSIHSPLAYSIVRNVLMKRQVPEGYKTIYDELISAGFSKKLTAQLINLSIHCGLEIKLAGTSNAEIVDKSATLLLTPPDYPPGKLLYLDASANPDNILCIPEPRSGREKREVCRQLVEDHDGMSLETRWMLLIFQSKGLNKQHIKI